jgi:hypothetical protein
MALAPQVALVCLRIVSYGWVYIQIVLKLKQGHAFERRRGRPNGY